MRRATAARPTRVHHVFSLGAKIATGVAALATVFWSADAAGAIRTRWTLPAGADRATFHLSAHVDGLVHPVDILATSVPAPAPANSRRHHPTT
jgi:hypothetical protein